MTDIINRLADPDDLRFLIMLAAVLLAGSGAAIACAAQPFLHRADAGFGFRWVKRR
jgi:hypothetical protein